MVYGEMSERQKSLTAKRPYGEVSLRQNVLTAKCPYGELSYGGMSYGEKSYGEKSGNHRHEPFFFYFLHRTRVIYRKRKKGGPR